MPEYTLLTAIGIAAVVLLECVLLRTGIFQTAQYWCAMAIVFAFQVLVDGFLTRLSAPVVIYAPQHHLGIRWPWDIPVEDFGFGFCLVTLTILVWNTVGRRGVDRNG
jgi:lycopene cyclase domain-containing protein